MTLTINKKTYEAGELVAYVEKLEKEYTELRDKNKALELYADLADEKIDQLKKENAEIEKLKCCGNCENEDDDSWHDSPCDGCRNYTHWKLRKIDEERK